MGERRSCPRCKGTGEIKEADRPRLTAASYMAGITGPVPCRMCRGTGNVWFREPDQRPAAEPKEESDADVS